MYIETVSGNFKAQVPHDSSTNYSSVVGNYSAYIRPYGAAIPNTAGRIYTSLKSGKVDVYFLELDHNSLAGNFNPLLGTLSHHDVGEGRLRVRYSYNWNREVNGTVVHGELEFDESSLGAVETGEGYVKARRGKKWDRGTCRAWRFGYSAWIGFENADNELW